MLLVPVAAVVVAGCWYAHSGFGRHRRWLRTGAPIVYRVVETPGEGTASEQDGVPRCCVIHKYWRVQEVFADGWIVALTPRREHYYLRRDDPNLRKANLVERFRYATRFPTSA